MRNTLKIAALLAFLASPAAAQNVIGTPPGTGFGQVDGRWLNGLSQGSNFVNANGITAHAGGTQAAALALPPQAFMVEVDTVATNGDSVLLPFCLAPDFFVLRNAGTGTLNVYAQTVNNPATASTDSINGNSNSTADTLSTNTSKIYFCAKNGVWSSK